VKKAESETSSGRKFKFLGFILLLFLLWIFLAPFLAKNLIVEKPPEKADAILVLAGSHTYRERTQKAAELFRNGAAPRVFLTDDGEQAGWSKTEQRNPPFVELARKSLIAGGVAAENIEILAPPVSGTIYEARVLSEKARSDNLSSVLLVTSAYHTRRALSTFERVFAENNQSTRLGIAAPPPGIQTPPPERWWFSRFGWQIVAGEYVKSAGYWVYY
jgi:uncharacterized SAM-binding protein YcdF (DUF218 family)